MAARDRWESEYTCPKCAATGLIKWSEEDHPWMRGDTRTADHVDLPLVVKSPKKFEHQVWCGDCNIRVDKR